MTTIKRANSAIGVDPGYDSNTTTNANANAGNKAMIACFAGFIAATTQLDRMI